MRIIETFSEKMEGVIGVPCAEQVRYSSFYDNLMNLQRPVKTVVRPCSSSSVALNRNTIAQYALDIGAEWVFFVDDDQEFPPDLLMQLLAHKNKDIIGALYLRRDMPFPPLIFDRKREDGFHFARFLKQGDGGLMQVEAIGSGGLLVKRRVFETMRNPWFTLGQIIKDQWSDDIDFCRKARAAGFEIWCDLEATMGHTLAVSVWPARAKNFQWVTQLKRGSMLIAELPAAMGPPIPGQQPPK